MKNGAPTVSVVIPTLNEEKYLPHLLSNIKEQSFKDYEVIVADAGSKDRTVELAKEWGARVVKGGKPAAGRNAGARAARAEHIFFFDSDVELPSNFFENALKEIEKRGLSCATWRTYASDGDMGYQLVFDVLSEAQRVSVSLGVPLAGGFAIFVTKEIFEQVGGFDELAFQAEDHDFVKAASKKGKFGFLKSASAGVSTRRWQKEGGMKLAAKYLYSMVYRTAFGNVRKEIFKYEFGNYDFEKRQRFPERLKEVLEELTDLENLKNRFSTDKGKRKMALERFRVVLEKLFSDGRNGNPKRN